MDSILSPIPGNDRSSSSSSPPSNQVVDDHQQKEEEAAELHPLSTPTASSTSFAPLVSNNVTNTHNTNTNTNTNTNNNNNSNDSYNIPRYGQLPPMSNNQNISSSSSASSLNRSTSNPSLKSNAASSSSSSSTHANGVRHVHYQEDVYASQPSHTSHHHHHHQRHSPPPPHLHSFTNPHHSHTSHHNGYTFNDNNGDDYDHHHHDYDDGGDDGDEYDDDDDVDGDDDDNSNKPIGEQMSHLRSKNAQLKHKLHEMRLLLDASLHSNNHHHSNNNNTNNNPNTHHHHHPSDPLHHRHSTTSSSSTSFSKSHPRTLPPTNTNSNNNNHNHHHTKQLNRVKSTSELEVRHLSKQNEALRRSNETLRKQFSHAMNSDKITLLNNRIYELQQSLSDVLQENKTLKQELRRVIKDFDSIASAQSDFPSIINNLMEESRFYKEKVRRYQQKIDIHEKQMRKQQAHMVDLESKNRKLVEKIRDVESNSSGTKKLKDHSNHDLLLTDATLIDTPTNTNNDAHTIEMNKLNAKIESLTKAEKRYKRLHTQQKQQIEDITSELMLKQKLLQEKGVTATTTTTNNNSSNNSSSMSNYLNPKSNGNSNGSSLKKKSYSSGALLSSTSSSTSKASKLLDDIDIDDVVDMVRRKDYKSRSNKLDPIESSTTSSSTKLLQQGLQEEKSPPPPMPSSKTMMMNDMSKTSTSTFLTAEDYTDPSIANDSSSAAVGGSLSDDYGEDEFEAESHSNL